MNDRLKTGVATSIGIEPGNGVTEVIGATRVVTIEEFIVIGSDEHLAIRLHSERSDLDIIVGKSQVSKVRIEAAGNESAVQTPIRIEPGTPVSVRAVDEGERTAEQHLPIRLQGERPKNVHLRARIETAVRTSVGIEPGNSAAVRAVDGGERTPDEHLAIGLQRDRSAIAATDCCAGNESVVQTSVGIEPGDAAAVRAIHRDEITAGEHFAIGLQDDTPDPISRRGAACACARIETAVQTSIGIEPGNAVSVRAVYSVEITADEHLPIRLQRRPTNKY